ncbi:MAG: LEPR-XLL domain-containing protein, partial [Chloroflexi bacterium]|nr:LEPR-XLL domain-containing protein [Chloroflexota bacterium]
MARTLFKLEALEPRVLLSGDGATGALPPSGDHDPLLAATTIAVEADAHFVGPIQTGTTYDPAEQLTDIFEGVPGQAAGSAPGAEQPLSDNDADAPTEPALGGLEAVGTEHSPLSPEPGQPAAPELLTGPQPENTNPTTGQLTETLRVANAPPLAAVAAVPTLATISGKTGDVITVDLKSALGGTGSAFELLNKNTLPADAQGIIRVQVGTSAAGIIPPLLTPAFASSGIFYFIPALKDTPIVGNTDMNDRRAFTRNIDLQVNVDGVTKDIAITLTNGFSTAGQTDAVTFGSAPLDVYRQQQRLKFLGYPGEQHRDEMLSTLSPIPVTGTLDSGTQYAITLFNSIIDPGNLYRLRQTADWQDNAKKFLNSADAPRWIKLESNVSAERGWENYNTDGPPGQRDNYYFGTSWAHEVIVAAGALNNTGSVLEVNDLSLPSGGPNPDHASHLLGMEFDVRHVAGAGQRWYDLAAAAANFNAVGASSLWQRIADNKNADSASYSGTGVILANGSATLAGGAGGKASATVVLEGSFNDLNFQAKNSGTAWDGVRIEFIKQTGAGALSFTYVIATQTLTIRYRSGQTSANDIMAGLAASSSASKLFTATLATDSATGTKERNAFLLLYDISSPATKTTAAVQATALFDTVDGVEKRNQWRVDRVIDALWNARTDAAIRSAIKAFDAPRAGDDAGGAEQFRRGFDTLIPLSAGYSRSFVVDHLALYDHLQNSPGVYSIIFNDPVAKTLLEQKLGHRPSFQWQKVVNHSDHYHVKIKPALVNPVTAALDQNEEDVLSALADASGPLGNDLTSTPKFNATLWAINQSSNGLLHSSPGPDIGDFLKIKEVLAAYFAEVQLAGGTPDSDGLSAALQNALLALLPQTIEAGDGESPVFVTGGFFSDVNELRFDVTISAARVRTFDLDLGADVSDLGLSLNAAVTADVLVELNLNFSFGLKLDDYLNNSIPLRPDDAFLRVNQLSLSAAIALSDVNVNIALGLLDASIQNGTISMNVDLDATLMDLTPADGGITLTDLRALNFSFEIASSGTLDVELPIAAQLGTFEFGAGRSPRILITDSDLFSAPPPDFRAKNFDGLLDFKNMTPQDILALLQQLCGWLGQFRDSPVFDVPIPLTHDWTLGDVLDLKEAFVEKLLPVVESKDENSTSKPSFNSVQELAQKLVARLGGNPDNVHYDPISKELTFNVNWRHAFDPISVPIGFDIDLENLADLSTNSALTVEAEATLKFTFGVDLRPRTEDTTPNNPSDDDSLAHHFFIRDLSLAGTANLIASDIDASARLGFLGIAIVDGAGTANATLSLELQDPGTVATDGRIDLPELFAALTNPGTLVKQPTLSGFAQFVFPVRVSPNILEDPPPNPALSLTWPDITNPRALRLTPNADMQRLFDVGRLTFGDIVQALRALSDYLRTLEQFSFLNDKLPLLNLSVSELVEQADRLAQDIDEFETNPANTLQAAEEFLEDALGIPDPPGNPNADSPLVELSIKEKVVRIDLALDGVFDQQLPMNLDLGALATLLGGDAAAKLGGVTNLVDVGGSAKLNVQARAKLDVNLGIDFTDPFKPAPFLFDTTGLALEAKVVGTGLTFTAALGPLGVFIGNDAQKGTATLRSKTDRDGNPVTIDPAAFTVGIKDDNTVQTVTLAGGSAADTFTLSFKGQTTNALPRTATAAQLQTALGALATIGGGNVTVTGGGAQSFIVTFINNKLGSTDLPQLSGTATGGTTVSVTTLVAGDGRYYLADLDTTLVDLALDGAVEVKLPIFFPTNQTKLEPDLSVTIPDLAALFRGDVGQVTITPPDLASTINSLSVTDQLGVIVDGLDKLLATLQAGLENEVFGRNLPLVGGKLKDAARFIAGFRDTVLAKVRGVTSGAAVRQALFDAFGPAGLNVLVDGPDDDTTVDLDDVVMVSDANRVQFNLHLAQNLALLQTGIDFDMGLPGLGLDVDGNVTAKLGWDFRFGFGVSKTDGFYFDTAAKDNSGAPIPELLIDLEVGIPGLSATGRLGFLQLAVTDDAASPTHFGGKFTVDIKDPHNDNSRLTFSEMASGLSFRSLIDPRLTAVADVNLKTVVSFGSGAKFPSIHSDLNLDWTFDSVDLGDKSKPLGSKPTVAFNHVRLDLGSFLSDLLGPIVSQIQQVLQPIQPVLDILTTPLPVLSDLPATRAFLDRDGDKQVTLLEMAALLGDGYDSAIQFVGAVREISRIANLLGSITTSGNAVFINLGSFNLGGTDARMVSDLKNATPTVTESAASASAQVETNATAAQKNALNGFKTIPGAGFQFPFLDKPSALFGVLLGQPVTLVTYDMPALAVTFSYSQFFPILGPLGVTLTGTVAATADFAFGYDTLGLQQFSRSKRAVDLLNGLFVSDRAKPDGTGADVAEVRLSASIEAFGSIDAVIAAAGVGGGITAMIDFNLNDPDHDGKVRVNELTSNFNRGPLCVFDIEGKLKAGLSAFVRIGVAPFDVTKRFRLAEVTLLDFMFGCTDSPA